MINFFPGAIAPVLGFAFFEAEVPFVRFLFAITEVYSGIEGLLKDSAKASVIDVLCRGWCAYSAF
jgi:hypothetical protein